MSFSLQLQKRLLLKVHVGTKWQACDSDNNKDEKGCRTHSKQSQEWTQSYWQLNQISTPNLTPFTNTLPLSNHQTNLASLSRSNTRRYLMRTCLTNSCLWMIKRMKKLKKTEPRISGLHHNWRRPLFAAFSSWAKPNWWNNTPSSSSSCCCCCSLLLFLSFFLSLGKKLIKLKQLTYRLCLRVQSNFSQFILSRSCDRQVVLGTKITRQYSKAAAATTTITVMTRTWAKKRSDQVIRIRIRAGERTNGALYSEQEMQPVYSPRSASQVKHVTILRSFEQHAGKDQLGGGASIPCWLV